jgi:hypothetical protein
MVNIVSANLRNKGPANIGMLKTYKKICGLHQKERKVFSWIFYFLIVKTSHTEQYLLLTIYLS